jgi:hypothetical protein
MSPAPADEMRMRHFTCLDQEQQAAAIQCLHAAGQSELTIAGATGLSVEQIRCVCQSRSMARPHLLPVDARVSPMGREAEGSPGECGFASSITARAETDEALR